MATVEAFPDPHDADENGILAVGGNLQPQTLLAAYSHGIFPWPIDELGLAWFSPDPRAVLDFKDLHVSKSLKKVMKRADYDVSIDRCFGRVIRECAAQERPGQDGTWITPNLERSYCAFHQQGYAHSLEIWRAGDLVGGIYGVAVGGVFSAESMFHRLPNASKLAVVHLVEYLRGKNLSWIDIQVMTPHMRRFGAKHISRREFLTRLNKAKAQHFQLF